MTKPAKQYQKELDEEIDRDREKQGKGKLPPKAEKQETTITQSKTDPESEFFVKGEHESQFAYVANTACDKHNFILDFVVRAGNIHNSQMFHNLYEKLERISQATESIVVDAGYKTPGIAREILRDGKIMTKDGFFKKHEYVYDEYYDCYLCPENQVLKYATTNREGYREYKSDAKICQACPKRKQCTLSRNYMKVVTRHVWADYSEQAEEYRYIPKHREIYKQRKQTIERIFADAKEKHEMRYTTMCGLAKVTMPVTLTFACMMLKKLAIWKGKTWKLRPVFACFYGRFENQFRCSTFRESKQANAPFPVDKKRCICLQSEARCNILHLAFIIFFSHIHRIPIGQAINIFLVDLHARDCFDGARIQIELLLITFSD